jgi:hypothetical protein
MSLSEANSTSEQDLDLLIGSEASLTDSIPTESDLERLHKNLSPEE